MTQNRIGAVAESLGLTPRTLRYWEERGLIPRAARTAGGFRAYGEHQRRAAQGVLALKASGLSLDRIRALQVSPSTSSTALGGFEDLDAALAHQQAAVQQQLSRLKALHDALALARATLSKCDGCHGKALDHECPPCLTRSTGSSLPDVLVSLLRIQEEEVP